MENKEGIMDNQRMKEVQEEKLGVIGVNDNIVCKGCIFANGSTPFDDTPYKSNCAIYTREDGRDKPNEVYFNGAPCKYRKEK